MAFKAFSDLQNKFKSEAQAWVLLNFENDIQSRFADFNWDHLYDNYAKKDDTSKSLHSWVSETISKSLVDEIDKKLSDKDLPYDDVVMLLTEGSQKAFYRHCAVMGIESHDPNSGWMSKRLYLNKLCSQSKFGHLIRYPDISRQLENVSKSLGSYNCVLNNYSDLSNNEILENLSPITQGFIENGKKEDFVNYLLSCTLRSDGRYNVKERHYLDNSTMARAFNLILDRSDCSAYDIATLRADGSIKPVQLWDTNYFNQHHAPVVTQEGIELANKYFESRSHVQSLFLKIKDNMSREDIMAHLVPNYRHSIESWNYGINRFAAITGEKVTFSEARDLVDKGAVSIYRTRAYLDYIDANFNPDEYSQIETDVYFTDEDTVFEITVSCHSLKFDDIEDELSKESLKYDELNSSAYAGNSLIFRGGVFRSLTQERLNEIASKLKGSLEKINSHHPLPGDVVEVVGHEDYEDLPVKKGYKGQVVSFDGGFAKLKGVDESIDKECLLIKKKYIPKAEHEVSASL